MTFECVFQRCHKHGLFAWLGLRSGVMVTCLLLVLVMVSLCPGLWSIRERLHFIFTGTYLPGHHSVLMINSPTEQAAKDIGRYIWKGEIQEASETLMLIKTRTSRIRHIIDYVRSVHPYTTPEVLSVPVEDGSVEYLRWMDEVIPDH